MFWELTPRELYDEIEAIRLRQQDRFDRDITLAWHIEALHRQKKLPGLMTLLSQRVRRQSRTEQRAMLQQLSEQYHIPLKVGGKVLPMKPRAKVTPNARPPRVAPRPHSVTPKARSRGR